VNHILVPAVRSVLAAAALGSVAVLALVVPALARDLDGLAPAAAHLRVPVLVIVVLGVVSVQVVLASVWRLVTLVRRGTVFSHRSFRYVDRVLGAVSLAAVLLFVLGVVLAPGETVAPGVVLLVGVAGLLVALAALVVLVLRLLLAQAVARDLHAQDLEAELEQVV
jgi:hypothetical protein